MGLKLWWTQCKETWGLRGRPSQQACGQPLEEPAVVPVHGTHLMLRLDPVDSLELLSRPFEPSEVSLVKELLQPGQTVLDIGANIGYYTLLFSHLVGPAGRVIAFEPDPNNYALLQRNIADNNCENVTAHQLAVGARKERLKLFQCAGNNGMHRAYQSICCGDDFVSVDAVVLDQFLAQGPAIDFIKMDIEGFELFALQGMSHLLEKHSPTIFVEFSPSALAEAGVTTTSFIRFFADRDYAISRVADDAESRLVREETSDLLRRAAEFDGQAASLTQRERCETVQEFGNHLEAEFERMGKPFEILQNWICEKPAA